MRIKEVKPIKFLFFRAKTKVSELVQFLPVGQELYKEALNHHLKILGPVHWHYFGFTGDESQSFILEISLPVDSVITAYDGQFHFKRTDTFKCLSTMHEGGWLDIPQTYGKMFQFIGENKLQPNATNREIYLNVDLTDPAGNSTEIQIGIK